MITKAELERYTLQVIDSSFDAQITKWIEQTVSYIEKATNREYTVSAEEERLFDGNGRNTLTIDDFTELTSVEINGSAVDVTVYQANRLPKYKLQRTAGFPKGEQNVAVTATWGQEPDEDIKFACLVLTAGIILNQVNGKKSSESIGSYSVSYATEAQRDDYKRAMQILQMNRNIRI